MRNRLLIPLIVAFLAAAMTLHWAIKAKPGEKEINEVSKYLYNAYWWQGKYPPDFELTLLSGEKFVLSEHIGKEVIILNFFTTWCGPCKDELPELSGYYLKHRGEGLTFIGIDGNEKRDLVASFVADEKIPYPVGIDEGGRIQEKLVVRSYPTTVLVGVDGKIALYETGTIDNADVTFQSLVQENLATLSKKGGITRESYQAAYQEQPLPDTTFGYNPPQEVILEGRAGEFAMRMKCPYTHSTTQDCHCVYCAELKRKLKAMTLEGISDEQVLKALFLADTLKADTLVSHQPKPK